MSQLYNTDGHKTITQACQKVSHNIDDNKANILKKPALVYVAEEGDLCFLDSNKKKVTLKNYHMQIAVTCLKIFKTGTSISEENITLFN